ncbi:MAG: hypothetical protein KDG57_07430, partial [Rhodoferax sp.]|nr:hypothetical protein [Rhodoferax sp.]
MLDSGLPVVSSFGHRACAGGRIGVLPGRRCCEGETPEAFTCERNGSPIGIDERRARKNGLHASAGRFLLSVLWLPDL